MKIKKIIPFVVPFIAFQSLAISLTSHRIYLDPEAPTSSFMVFNQSDKVEDCQLSLRHFSFKSDGNLGDEIKGEQPLPSNSANRKVRFSPRGFTVLPGKNQSVRFSFKAKRNDLPQEYHSYLSVNCGSELNQDAEIITLSPRLVHNIPIIARTKKLNAEASIDGVSLSADKNLSFKIKRTGNRSLYGYIAVENKETKKIVKSLKGLSIYTQSQHREFNLKLNGDLPKGTYTIHFIEDTKYGGDIEVAKDFII